MSKPFEGNKMLIVDPPEELILEGPFNRAVCKKILVFNPSKQTRIAFKLKTTTPRLFFVRPNVGLIRPEETIKIDIFVHPIGHDYHVQRHKFLMQATEANEPISDLHDFWKHLNPSFIWDTIIKVKLVEPRSDVFEAKRAAAMDDGMGEHQDKELSHPMAKLQQQVDLLEEERQSLMVQVDTLNKEKEEQRALISAKQQKVLGFTHYFIIALFLLVAAIAGGFFAKNYM